MTTYAPSIDPDGLEAYFTDVEHLRGAFKDLVAAPVLSKRLLIIHGVGGVGKSSLLRMFRLHCKGARVPLGLASGDEAKSAVDVLAVWADDLKDDSIKLPAFVKTFAHYQAIQASVEEQARTSAEVVGKLAVKTAEGVAGSVAGAAIGSIIPIVGTLAGAAVGALVGTSGEALTGWLSGFLNKPDIDLLLDPVKRLTDDFLADLTRVAPKRRLVLLLDTFEQLSALEDWVRDLAQRLNANVVLVVAGRAVPNWSRQWLGWLAQADVQELKPMTPAVMRALIERYYATMRGGSPDPTQVTAIVDFARGLPVVVISAVQLWVAYGVEDFESVKPQVIADLVDRLLEGVPRELVPTLEAAAALRWFNKDVLRAVTEQNDVTAAYDELRRFPFIRPRVEGLALHDAVREIIDENTRDSTPARHRELHKQAATYFTACIEQATGEGAGKLRLERLYHQIRADEHVGMQLFQDTAERLVSNRLINELRTLLIDLAAHDLKQRNSHRWQEYYHARLANLEQRYADAEIVYQSIAEDETLDPKLRAYANCDWGDLLIRIQRLREPGGVDRARRVIERSLEHPVDTKLIWNYANLGGMHVRLGADHIALANYELIKRYFIECHDSIAAARIWSEIVVMYVYQGNWRKVFEAQREGLSLLPHSFDRSFTKSSLMGWAVAWAWAGRYADAERNASQREAIVQDLGLPESPRIYRDMGFVLGMQGKYSEAIACFQRAIRSGKETYGTMAEAVYLAFLGVILTRAKQVLEAERALLRSLEVKRLFHAYRDIPEVLISLGQLSEVKALSGGSDASIALEHGSDWFTKALDLRWTHRKHLDCAALTGLVRIKYAQGDNNAIPPLLADAEQLAQQYEYNDHLASLRLSQGHLAWDGHMPERGSGFDAALKYYQQALIYALRYNRFLLDEVLWGGGVGTPLKPIISHCLERTFEGQRMLRALRDWWQTGTNDVGSQRPDTISLIPEGIPLLEAERIAREGEPGDRTLQCRVLEALSEHI